jgi:aldose 1-epimerase
LSETLELGDGRWKLVVAPSLGGSLLACEYDGVAVLQPTGQPAGSRRRTVRCCHFPLVPFSNRIENSRFAFDGLTVRLAPNVDGSPHALHGHGWQAPWQVIARHAAGCTLEYGRASTADWPWPYRAQQVIDLADGALCLTLAVENLGVADMPCGLGFHPFLPRTPGVRLALEATHVWNGSAGNFPAERVAIREALDFRAGPRIADREGMDHCFDGWNGHATVTGEQDGRGYRLSGCAATRHVIVYTPANADHFCVEPVTHAVNALNLPDASLSGLWRLEPREQRRITMTITRLD